MSSSKFNLSKTLLGRHSREAQYARLNVIDSLRLGDLATSIEILISVQKHEPLQIDFDAIDTLDDVWDVENQIHNAVLAGLISLAMAEFALARVSDIDHTISENERIKAENAAYKEERKIAREEFPEKFKEYKSLNSFERMRFESDDPMFKVLRQEYEEAQAKKNKSSRLDKDKKIPLPWEL